ncbi:MAG TPA: hypothetical protein VIO58_04695 [Candidatus Methanoperedens sp.]
MEGYLNYNSNAYYVFMNYTLKTKVEEEKDDKPMTRSDYSDIHLGKEMTKKHFILVGFGDAGKKIFPALIQFCRYFPRSLDISIVDVKSLEVMLSEGLEKTLEDRFEKFSNLRLENDEIKKYLKILEKIYFVDEKPRDEELIPKGLIPRIDREEPIIVYLAVDPDLYLSALKKYLHLGDIFVIEKPIAKDSKKAEELIKFIREKEEDLDKLFIPVDHYRGKKQVLDLVETIIKREDFYNKIKAANIIVFSLLEKRKPPTNTYFVSTGIIADMMPHVLALLKKILNCKFDVEIKQVKSAFHKSFNKFKKYHPQYNETFAEMELFLIEEGGLTRTVIIRLGKGTPDEDRTVAFVDSNTNDYLKMKLKPLKDAGIYSISGGKQIKLELEVPKHMSSKWDNSWYNIIHELMHDEYDKFLTMEDAQKFVEIIEKIKGMQK